LEQKQKRGRVGSVCCARALVFDRAPRHAPLSRQRPSDPATCRSHGQAARTPPVRLPALPPRAFPSLLYTRSPSPSTLAASATNACCFPSLVAAIPSLAFASSLFSSSSTSIIRVVRREEGMEYERIHKVQVISSAGLYSLGLWHVVLCIVQCVCSPSAYQFSQFLEFFTFLSLHKLCSWIEIYYSIWIDRVKGRWSNFCCGSKLFPALNTVVCPFLGLWIGFVIPCVPWFTFFLFSLVFLGCGCHHHHHHHDHGPPIPTVTSMASHSILHSE
jgi:hypothetical protein